MSIEVLAAVALVLSVVVAAFGISVAVGMALGRLGIDELDVREELQPLVPPIPAEGRQAR